MLASLGFILILGLSMGFLCQKIKLPKIIGMLLTGILLGPYGWNVLDEKILLISPELRKIALIIILLKAGFSFQLQDLKKVGRPAMLLSFLPASFEILAYFLFAPFFLGISRIEAALMGSVLAAVSPAVVVPRMIQLMEEKYGTEKGIPQMILAGATCDDIFVIVLFTSFLGMLQGEEMKIGNFINIPISIVLGTLLGVFLGYFLAFFFEKSYRKKCYIRNSTKVIIVLAFAFLGIAIEGKLEGKIAISSLLAVVSMASVLKGKSTSFVSERLSEKYGKLWIFAEILLFVLIGSAVDVRYTLSAGHMTIAMILLSLLFRAFGVLLCTLRTNLLWKERFFCVIAYLPKATVQAAIGAIPLTLGLQSGKIILAVAVTAVVLTAPLGAFGMDRSYPKLLKKEM